MRYTRITEPIPDHWRKLIEMQTGYMLRLIAKGNPHYAGLYARAAATAARNYLIETGRWPKQESLI
jgi:hypothetical protein